MCQALKSCTAEVKWRAQGDDLELFSGNLYQVYPTLKFRLEALRQATQFPDRGRKLPALGSHPQS